MKESSVSVKHHPASVLENSPTIPLDFKTECYLKIAELCDLPHTIEVVDGKSIKKYNADDVKRTNYDARCLELFCESVNWDKRICTELLFNDYNSRLRAQVIETGYSTLVYRNFKCKCR